MFTTYFFRITDPADPFTFCLSDGQGNPLRFAPDNHPAPPTGTGSSSATEPSRTMRLRSSSWSGRENNTPYNLSKIRRLISACLPKRRRKSKKRSNCFA